MKKMLSVCRYELASTLRQKGFMISLSIICLLLFFGPIIGINMMLKDSGDETGIVDYSELYLIYDESNVLDREFVVDYFSANTEIEYLSSVDELQERYRENDSAHAYHVVDETTFNLYALEVSRFSNNAMTDDPISALLKAQYGADELGIGYDEYLVATNVSIQSKLINIEANTADTNFVNLMLFQITSFILYFVLILFGTSIATVIVKEKKNRLVEIFITSLKPSQLLFGKVLASVLMVALTLIVFAVTLVLGCGIGFVTAGYGAELRMVMDVLQYPILGPTISSALQMLLLSFVIINLSSFVYFSLFATCGSLASEVEDASAAIMPILMPIIISFMLVMFVDSPSILVIMTYVPFSAPFAILYRFSIGTISTMELLFSIGFFTVVGIILCLLAAKIYRTTILMYGQKIRIKTLLEVLKG